MSNIISGTEYASHIKQDLKEKINNLNDKPAITVILIGDKPESSVYVNMKKNACEYVGIRFHLEKLPHDVDQHSVLSKIIQLNMDDDVHGIIVQLPLPSHLEERKILDTIHSHKDVDCLTTMNVGKLIMKNPTFLPCTPKGILKLILWKVGTIESKEVVILGRSNIVGLPLFHMLTQMNATVTLCHSKTKNIKEQINRADILIAAIGSPKFVQGEWLKKDCIVIDVGINRIPCEKSNSGYRLVGDVDFDSCQGIASYITPVPGGVGPMTVTMLMENTLEAFYKNKISKDEYSRDT